MKLRYMRQYKKITRETYEIEDSLLTASEKEAAYMAFDFNKKWLLIFGIFIILIICILVARVFYLSIVKGDYYSFIASGNSVRSIPIISMRGTIYDINGKILADNIPSINIIILPKSLPKSEEEKNKLVQKVSRLLNLDESHIKMVIADAIKNNMNTVIAENITHEQALVLRAKQKELPGIYIQQTAIRNYIDGKKFAHVIGYEGLIQKDEREKNPKYLLIDRIGKTGIEYQYEKYLHGTHGAQRTVVDSRGNIIDKLADIQPQNGSEVHLNIDAELQKFIFNRLQKELKRADTNRAMAIAIDPQSGAVRAMVSLPSYDNNKFAQGIDAHTYNNWISNKDRPLFNRAIGGAYPPGSTVKPVMGVATLAEHIVSPNYEIESRGGLQLGSFFFGDWRAHGFTDLRRAIAVSSDVYFYTVGGGYGKIVGLGIDRMKEYMQKFGYGEKTGIDLPGEAKGFYPDKEWKQRTFGEKWYIGNTYHAAIGQGYVTATALQVLNSITTIANGGILYEPHVVSYIINKNNNERINIDKKVIRDNTYLKDEIKIVQEGMRQTVTNGTATMLSDLKVPVAGKTGTAQFGDKERVHSWFVSYAPYDNPEIAIIIMVENQTHKISSAPLPVAHDIYKWYFGGRDEDVVNNNEDVTKNTTKH